MITRLPRTSDNPPFIPAVSSTHFNISISATRRQNNCRTQSLAAHDMWDAVHSANLAAGPERKCNLPLYVKRHEQAEKLKQFVMERKARELEQTKQAAFKMMAKLMADTTTRVL